MIQKHMFSILTICLFLGGFLIQFPFSGICTPSYAENLFTDADEDLQEDVLFFTDREEAAEQSFTDAVPIEEESWEDVLTEEAAAAFSMLQTTAFYPVKEENRVSLAVDKTVLPTEDPYRFRLRLEAGLEGEVRKGVSVVLVLDASDSMMENGAFPVLKTAVSTFIEQLSAASPESEVSVIWYGGGEPGGEIRIDQTGWSGLEPERIPFLKEFVQTETTQGNTPMGAALEAALSLLRQAQYADRFCVFFTDGMPGYTPTLMANSLQSNFNCGAANRALDAARAVKDPSDGGAVLYTIGYGLDSGPHTSFYFHEGDPYGMEDEGHTDHGKIRGTAFLRDFIATSGRHYAVSAEPVLMEVFDVLAAQVIRSICPRIEYITDVVAPPFELSAACRERLQAEGAQIREGEDGQTVIWPSPQVGFYEAQEAEGSAWRRELEICVRKPCPEGVFPTNTADSAVYTGEGPVRFPIPCVTLVPPQAGALPACGGEAAAWIGAGAVLVLFSLRSEKISKKG